MMVLSKNHIDATQAHSVETGRDDRPVPRDEPRPSVKSGVARGTSGGPALAYGGIAVIVAAAWLVNSLTAADDAVRRGGAYQLGAPMFFQGTSVVITLALLPLMRRGVALARASDSWPIAAIRASVVCVLFALAHILGMVTLRKFFYWGLGSSYAFNLVTEFPYEFRKDIVTALFIGLTFWSLDRPAPTSNSDGSEPRRTGDDKTPNPNLWLRDGAASIRIDAREIVWVASAGNYVEFSLGAKRHLVRGTLAGEEARLLPFGFVRVHRTRLVNLNHAVAVALRPAGDFELRLDTGETVQGSRRYRQAVAELRGFDEGQRK
jgi:LytTr DNA-binding domain